MISAGPWYTVTLPAAECRELGMNCDFNHRPYEAVMQFCDQSQMGNKQMVKPSARKAINKLAIAGEQAGFSIEQMVELLSAGLSVETLLDLISWRLQRPNPLIPASSAHWVV